MSDVVIMMYETGDWQADARRLGMVRQVDEHKGPHDARLVIIGAYGLRRDELWFGAVDADTVVEPLRAIVGPLGSVGIREVC